MTWMLRNWKWDKKHECYEQSFMAEQTWMLTKICILGTKVS